MIGRERFTAGLPWGWWLRVTGDRLEDEQGRTWDSVRDAYWRGHLGFHSPRDIADQHQELLLRALLTIDNRGALNVESKIDLFGSDFLFWRFHQSWLGSIGLLKPAGQWQLFESDLSPEGRAVLLMLQATRQPEWEGMPARFEAEHEAYFEQNGNGVCHINIANITPREHVATDNPESAALDVRWVMITDVDRDFRATIHDNREELQRASDAFEEEYAEWIESRDAVWTWHEILIPPRSPHDMLDAEV